MRASTREAIILTVTNNRATDGPNTNTQDTGDAQNTSDNPHHPAAEGEAGLVDAVALEHSDHGAPEVSADAAPPLRAGTLDKPDTPTFAELDVQPDVVRALRDAGIEHTFAIQELTLPLALRGEDIIGQARTGTGKTLAFSVPMLQRLQLPGDGTPQVLIVVPTRELCVQVSRDLTEAGKHLGVRTLSVYGGRPYEPQIAALRKGVDVVIGTPGRLLDLAEQRHLVLGKVRGLVLDEADEMLDLGFLPDVERILRMVPEQRQTMLFSATMPGPILKLARAVMQQPTHIRAEQANESAIHERTRQFVYRAHAMDKDELIARVLQATDRGLMMIFSRTKRSAQRLADELAQRGFAAAAVHGDLGQGAREKALRAFRSGKIDTLVATDVAARGIDVEGVTHVINLQCPDDENTYVHRIGRTGRAGREGVAITLVDWDEESRWKMINDTLGLGRPEPVETYSTSEHLHSDLAIPADATGRLPLSKRTRPGLDAEADEDDATGPRRRGRTRGRSRGGRTGSSRGAATRSGAGRGGSAGQQHPASRSEDAEPAGTQGVDETRPAGRRRRRRTRGGETVDSAPQAADAPAGDSPSPGRLRRRGRTRGSGSARAALGGAGEPADA